MPRPIQPFLRIGTLRIVTLGLLFALVFGSAQVACAAELPTVKEVLAIHRANKQKLSRLHLQLTQTYETTEALCRQAQVQADEREKVVKHFAVAAAMGGDITFKIDGRDPTAEEKTMLLEHFIGRAARQEIKNLRAQSKPFRSVRLIEFFKDGDDYQCRTPAKWDMDDDERAAWTFLSAPLSKASLVEEYGETRIFSRSSQATPAGRLWRGNDSETVSITQGHLPDSLDLPPMTDVTHPTWDNWHPYDGFFLAADDKYRVVREEAIDGRTLLVVDSETPLEGVFSSEPDGDSESESDSDPGSESTSESPPVFSYRAWLDMARGAVPVKLYQSQVSASQPSGYFDHYQPNGITRTENVRELADGAYYPAKTVTEDMQHEADATKLSETEWITLPDGKREVPLVAMRRYTWDCSLVEVPQPFAEDFFALALPDGVKIYDNDADELIGALERKPPVKVGQQAPPLTIGRWLDGQPRTLEDFKGQVVVLDFWGLWCSACRSSVPQLIELQKQAPSGVTFISIHNAEKDPEELAARIKQFAESTGWKFLAAIDAGTMIEDSITSADYGVLAFPTTVIIGPDGKIIYAEPEVMGPSGDEDDPRAMAEFEKQADAWYRQHFEAVGESWPLPKGLSEDEQGEIILRVEQKYVLKRMEEALRR